MKRLFRWTVILAICIGIGLFVTRPQTTDPALFEGLAPNPENGALVFAAMGCASCHMAAEDGTPDALPGGRRFVSDFGTFIAPNISPDSTHGIGGWSDLEIASAILHGTTPSGRHYFPAFPYTTYARTTPQDVTDLIAHLKSLPPQGTANAPHEIGFPFSIRAFLGGWKFLFADTDWVVGGQLDAQQTRGRYLVEAMGHCGECHTPRNAVGALKRDAWLTGAPNPSGDGTIPGITASQLDWSDNDVVAYLRTGFTPDFDTAGGSMAEIVENLGLLPVTDIEAIVAYLRRVSTPPE
jgi:mono/diheme cytochrome c family protein